MSSQSTLQLARMNVIPTLPKVLDDLLALSVIPREEITLSTELLKLFPHLKSPVAYKISKGNKRTHKLKKIGVVLSGGQAPGGHNVIIGLYDALKKMNKESQLIGFLDGPAGIINNKHIELTSELLAPYRNQGGFDVIGSGRDKIETPEQFQAAEQSVKALDLDGLVIIGGDDSNTNAALLANYFASKECKTKVVGVPKTIDGDLKNQYVEVSFGFDTAAKTYADIIGNLTRDALSAKKYYYFIKLMGRSASHVTLECALQTHPNMTLISEEVLAKQQTLMDVVTAISDLICKRASKGKDYGIILIPEGVIEFIPEIRSLISELNTLLAKDKGHDAAIEALASKEEKIAYASKLLSKNSLECFKTLPNDIQAQLLLGRDAHGNVQVSKIETERMLIEMVKKELKKRAKDKLYTGKFSPQPHFCGYEGRSCLPTNFDCQYCYALGHVAAVIVDEGFNGYMASVTDLDKDPSDWQAGAVPLTSMMILEERHGKMKPVIEKALVKLEGPVFKEFAKKRQLWEMQDDYLYPGPIQFFGPSNIVDAITKTLAIENTKAG